MELHQTLEPIAAKLDEVLSRKEIPSQYRDWGVRLLEHLLRPVRIVVTGLPGSGKSSLINMMLSKQVIGGSEGVSVLDVVYGKEARVIFELEDGSTCECTGFLADAAVPERVIRVQQELPDPVLKEQCYRELNLSNTPEISKRILAAALKDADIVLWCTNSFGDAEQSMWSVVPDEIKDHSFLVVTRADRQMMWGVLSETIESLEPIVEEEFFGLFPIATLQALSALNSGRETDMHLWRSSGGQNLCDEIKRQVNSGRSEDIDQAQMLLTQCSAESWEKEENPPVAGVSAPSESLSPVSTQLTETASSGGSVKTAREMLGNAVQILTSSGEDLLREIDGDDAVDTDTVLVRCAETLGALSSHLHETLHEHPALYDAQENVREGEEMLMLFQLERGEDAALDAVTLLLQLRKEIAIKESA